MRSYRKELWFSVPQRRQLINITPQVEQCLAESGISEGLCLVNSRHIYLLNYLAYILRFAQNLLGLCF